MLKNLNKSLNYIDLIIWILAIVSTYILFPIYFEAMIYPLPSSAEPWMSLDPSWLLHMNYANNHDFIWGEDIAYTYGPLAYLSTKVGWGAPKLHFLFYDLFITLNFFLLFINVLKDSKNKILTILIILTFVALYPVWVGSANAVILMGFLIFWVRKSLDEPNIIYYIFQAIILTLIFYIKFNTGLIAFPLFFCGIVYNVIVNWKQRRKLIVVIIALIVPFIIIGILAFPLKVSLYPYIIYGIEMVAGYNEIMYLDHPVQTRILAISIIVLSTTVLLLKAVDSKKFLLKNLAIFFLFGTGMFVLYKQGFVRGMEADFFIYSVLILLTIYDLHSYNYKKISAFLITVCLVVSLYFVVGKQNVDPSIAQKTAKLYFQQYKTFTEDSGIHLFPNNNQLPKLILDKIGNNTVDAYPWNTQMLIENKLNYSPRPAFQAHSTYTKAMEELNFEHYNSNIKAPEFVLYEYLAIDSRYPMFDEPKLNLIFSKNYFVSEIFDFESRKIVLLQKKKDFKPVKLLKVNEYAMVINSPLVPKKDIYYEIEMSNNSKGKIVSILDHAPDIKVEILSNNSYPYPFKTSKSLLKSGIFGQKYIANTTDFSNFMIDNNSPKLEEIQYYNFKPLDTKYFKDKFKISEYKIIQ